MSQDIVKASVGDLLMDQVTADALIDLAIGRDGPETTRLRLQRELADLASGLAGPSPSPVESVLASCAATCWFAYRTYEALFAQRHPEGISLRLSDHAQRRIDRAHRRFLSTIKTLATVRRLAVPALQINVARHQQIAQINSEESS